MSRRIWKKIVSMILVVALLVTGFPAAVFAESANETDTDISVSSENQSEKMR